MDGGKRPVWELPVFVIVVVSAVFILGSTFKHQKDIEKQMVLKYQLEILRQGTMLYKILNKTNPESLKQLIEGSYNLPNDPKIHYYVDKNSKVISDRLTDPYGNPYAYDPHKGWAKSVTPGLESW